MKNCKAKPPKRGRGRPQVVTLAVVQEIAADIGYGMTEEQACAAANVGYAAFKKAEQRNPEFVLAIKKGQAIFLRRALRNIADGGEYCPLIKGLRPWTGLAWLLERRHGAQFRRVDAHVGMAAPGGLLMSPEDEAELQRMAFEMFGKKGAKELP